MTALRGLLVVVVVALATISLANYPFDDEALIAYFNLIPWMTILFIAVGTVLLSKKLEKWLSFWDVVKLSVLMLIASYAVLFPLMILLALMAHNYYPDKTFLALCFLTHLATATFVVVCFYFFRRRKERRTT